MTYQFYYEWENKEGIYCVIAHSKKEAIRLVNNLLANNKPGAKLTGKVDIFKTTEEEYNSYYIELLPRKVEKELER